VRRSEGLQAGLKIDGSAKTAIKWLVWSAIAEPATGLMYAVADITELVKLEKSNNKRLTNSMKTSCD
jgi:hypothetical protein